MSQPNDMTLYNKVKREIYNKMPENSAYRSGLIVKTYKAHGGTYSGSGSSTANQKTNQGLTRWYKEDWQTNQGETTYKNKNDVFRPTKRINSQTPSTFGELSKNEIETAQKEKAKTGRVKSFKTK